MLWLRPDLAKNHPYAVDKMLVSLGMAQSLTEARRLIADGAIYFNNEKLIAPERGFLPVAIIGDHVSLADYISLGL